MERVLQKFINIIAKLPGFGMRSSRRAVLHLLQEKKLMGEIRNCLEFLENNVKYCDVCNNIASEDICEICKDHDRSRNLICVVETISELWAIERSMSFKGQYHVLGKLLSALDGITPEQLGIPKLEERVKNNGGVEVVIALSPTLEGRMTSHYIGDVLGQYGVRITRLALGIPIGADLEYIDEGTLSIAFQLRQNL